MWLVATAAILLFSFVPNIGFAGVDGTHHDIPYMTGEVDKGVCSFCHVPHNSQSERGLFSRASVYYPNLGRIGSFCYSCHDGTISPFAIVQAPEGSTGLEVLLNSHGTDVRNMDKASNSIESVQNANASGLLSQSTETGGFSSVIECTSCHDVHNNTYPPFLRKPMEDLCMACHSGTDMAGKMRWVDAEGPAREKGPHPINVTIPSSGIVKPKEGTGGMSFHPAEAPYTVKTFTSEEMGQMFTHWELGGHLVGNDQTKVACNTCHSAHMPSKNLLVAEAYTEPETLVCSGCHTDGHNLADPGLTGYYHPVFDESAKPYRSSPDEVFSIEISIPDTLPVAQNGNLVCTTCHVAHGGVPNKKLLRNVSSNSQYICNSCHIPSPDYDLANSHHVTGEIDYTSTDPFRYKNPSWWSGVKGDLGDLADGLQCIDCHTELAKDAHNW